MRTTYARAFLTSALAVASLASCGGGSSPQVAAPTPTTTAAPPPSTIAPTTTAAAPTTTAAPEPTTTAPSTTAAPTPPAEDAIKQAIDTSELARVTCLQDPVTCDAALYSRGAYLESERQFIETAISRRATVVTREDDPSYWAISTIEVSPDGLTATATGCRWDTGILAGPGGFPINEDKGSFNATISLVNENGKWWITNKVYEPVTIGANTCDPRA